MDRSRLVLGLCTIALAAMGGGAPFARAQIAFTDVTDAAGVAHFSESYGASFGDFNGDGYLDIYSSNHRTQDSLFLNRNGQLFADVGTQVRDWVNRPHADTHGGSWADFDNDGDQDLLISTGTGNLSQFLVNDHLRLVDRTAGSGLDLVNLGGRMPVWLDFNKDHLPDVFMTQYGGVAKLFGQNPPGGTFTEMSAAAKVLCVRFHYAQLIDVNNDGKLELLCPDEANFPQKIYDFSTFPWTRLYESSAPKPWFPLVKNVADSAVADFNNDGHMDVFILSGTQLRPSSVVQEGNKIEALLAGGRKGFNFVATTPVTYIVDWNKQEEGVGTPLTKVEIGAAATHPTSATFTLDPADPRVAGMPPTPTDASQLPVMQIGYDPTGHRWTLIIVTKTSADAPGIFSEGYIQVSSTGPITRLKATGLWPTDKPGRPTLLMSTPTGFVDNTVAAGLATPVQCSSVTAGDFDDDMYVDLYLACRTGASNISNILYHNNGNGTFTAVPDAGGAAGPIGLAVADGAGTADSVISGDYDVDGFLDLFVTNGFNLRPLYIGGPTKLFHNNRNANHWIELDLVGENSDRDATGARVYAAANGVTQFRVQDGRYHRWSQDSRRIHFGLAGATAVNFTVWWPDGTPQSFYNVPADKLYRITQNVSTPQAVAVGVALHYPCGPPTPALNGATDYGVFIWRDCPSGQWRMKTSASGGTATFTGTVNSTAAFTSVRGVGLSPDDVLNYTTNPRQIAFTFHTSGSFNDGVNFDVQDNTINCLSLTAPANMRVYYGPFRVPVTTPIDLETQTTCP